MRKRTAQLIFYLLYCLLAAVGFVLDFGFFTGNISTNPFVFYTSLSNMLCSGFMLAALIRRILRRTGEPWHRCKFLFVIMILVTAIVYNLLLNSYSSVAAYFANVKNALYHLILPVLFVLDWILYYKRGMVKPVYPLLAVGIPLVYVMYILLRAVIVKSAGTAVAVLYPYFFLNVDKLGWAGFAMWMAILLAALLLLGYSLYGMDRLLAKTKSKTSR